MLINSILFFTFSTFALLSSFFVIFSKNPIFSILFLIFAFFNVSSILFLFRFELLPISFLVIYVGAIAVLFLFVLMMLNIKITELHYSYTNFWPFSVILGFVFILEILTLFRYEFNTITNFGVDSFIFLSDFLNITATKINFLNIFSIYSNIKSVSYALFTNYLFSFLLSGFVLLLAMIATITLTLQKSFANKTQNVYIQILRQIV